MKRILIATDFSTRSDRALRRAVLIAGCHGAAVTLAHVVDDDQPSYLIDRQRDAARETLGPIAETIRQTDRVDADIVIATGDPFACILSTAEAVAPDLIVIGPHRRQFLDTFIGTTAERTIRRSRRPVLMANAVPSAAYRRSLLAVDLDEASRAAIEAASRFGLLANTSMTALHLFDAPALGMMKRSMSAPEAVEHYVAEEQRRAQAEVLGLLSACGAEHAQLRLEPLQGSPSASILSCANEERADLVVLGTNQRRGLQRLLLGSVAQQVLLDAEQDVLVVPIEAS